MDKFPRLILLLGSYDPETKNILYMLREYIARHFTQHIYALLLEDLEIYRCRKNRKDYALIIEGGDFPVAYLFHQLNLTNIIFIEKGGDEGAKEAGQKLDITIHEKLPILEKLKALIDIVCLTIILRHKELTRCGEYIELTFLLDMGAEPNKIKFLWNKNIPISTMVKELLAKYGFTIHFYMNEKELLEETHRIVYYNCLR